MELTAQDRRAKVERREQAAHLDSEQPSEFPVPAFGKHDLEPPANSNVFHPPAIERS
jgi:NADH-quinone oxidoreductase subunit B